METEIKRIERRRNRERERERVSEKRGYGIMIKKHAQHNTQ